MAIIPTIVRDGTIKELKTIEDSTKLGQLMIFVDLIAKGKKHPNLIVQPGSMDEKYPAYLIHELPIFTYSGLYYPLMEENK